ncbi:hypothetical protein [Halorubrum sp. N11]|uniref:hypothetical protein n=1 Tax=Halorubrum sp. N11 TaxID=3402276 RepID=UPI003EBFE88A
MTDRSETVGVRLTPAEREKFEDFLREEDEFDSISRFFRVAAHRHIATANEDVSIDPEEIIDAVDSAVTPISERLERVEDHVLSIDSSVTNDDKIDLLAQDLYSSLPTHSKADGLPDFDKIEEFDTPSDLALAQGISTPEIWAEYYDEELADVRRACARMLEYYPEVNYIQDTAGESKTHVPVHDDVGQTNTSRQVDSIAGQNSSSSRPQKTQEQGHSTVRRYYKESGD